MALPLVLLLLRQGLLQQSRTMQQRMSSNSVKEKNGNLYNMRLVQLFLEPLSWRFVVTKTPFLWSTLVVKVY